MSRSAAWLPLLAVLVACGSAVQRPGTLGAGLAPGDLLFQDLDCGPLCDAIEAVTEGAHGKDYSHVGIVVRSGDSLAVCEAIGDHVHLSGMGQFLARSPEVDAGIWPTAMRPMAERAASAALHYIGMPYDKAFLPDNDSLYCSELVALAFQQANGGQPLFERPAMTFKDPTTGTFSPAWVAYYNDLHRPIPEGTPGCNPGGLSRHPGLRVE